MCFRVLIYMSTLLRHSQGKFFAVSLQAAGLYKQKGRDYIVEDGDIIHFKFNAGAGLTGKKK